MRDPLESMICRSTGLACLALVVGGGLGCMIVSSFKIHVERDLLVVEVVGDEHRFRLVR